MIEIIPINRKSAVLMRSSVECLSTTATINPSVGRAHECLYCYGRGYSNYPREGKVEVYANTFEKLRRELPRKLKKPQSVFLSTSCDPFQPVEEVLDIVYEVLDYLLSEKIGVAFLTKGEIPERHIRLFKANASRVRAGFGLITLDDKILRIFEPFAPSARIRLAQAKECIDAGIMTQVRVDPVMPGLTDDERTLNDLCDSVSDAGIRRMALSVLFLRPAIARSLKRNIQDASLSTCASPGSI